MPRADLLRARAASMSATATSAASGMRGQEPGMVLAQVADADDADAQPAGHAAIRYPSHHA